MHTLLTSNIQDWRICRL